MDQSIPPVSPIIPPSKPKNHALTLIVAGAVILTVGIGIGLMLGKYLLKPKQITSYEECIKANGNAIQPMYPGVCTVNGQRFTQPTPTLSVALTPSPTAIINPTANWKTYKDELYGFEFKYLETDPAKQYLDNDLTMGYRLLLLRNVLKKQYFAIKIQKVDKNMSLLDYWKFESDIAKSGLIFSNCNPNQCFGAYKSWTKQAVFNLSNGEVGGKKALFIDNPMPGEYQNTIVLRLTNNYVLEIKKSNEPISDQILSTFKFTDQITDISDWKTYTSKEYGFSFKYPPTMNYTYPGGIRESQIDNHTQVDLYTFNDDLVLPVITVKQDQCRSDSILVEDGQQLLKLMTGIKNLIIKTKNGNCMNIFRDIYEPLDMLKRSNEILDQILSTFKFVEQTTLVPPDFQTQVAGVCVPVSKESVITVTIPMDNVPQPRCVHVTFNQKLKIINESKGSININVGKIQATLAPTQSFQFPKTLGEFLSPGGHSIAGAEIWLQ